MSIDAIPKYNPDRFGDLSGDGKVDADDLSILDAILDGADGSAGLSVDQINAKFGTNVSAENFNAMMDYDGNGVVDKTDIVELKNYILLKEFTEQIKEKVISDQQKQMAEQRAKIVADMKKGLEESTKQLTTLDIKKEIITKDVTLDIIKKEEKAPEIDSDSI
ncbi:MAG: dockerin type I domain-containing protein [Candidatus Margulisiibacteriota bacterium]|jgi:dihydropteroate synthase